MTDQPQIPTPADVPPPRKGRRWKTPAIVAGALALGLVGGAATTAFSQGMSPMAMFHGGPMGGPFGGPMGPRGQMDPAQMNTMIERGIKHLAIEIDATADQQTRLITIAQSAAKDLLPVRDQLQAAREKGRALLTQPTLDRTQIEAFRAEQIALVDQASKRVTQAIADANDVLTPDQRIKIGNRLAELGGPGMGGPGGPGMGGPGGPRGFWRHG